MCYGIVIIIHIINIILAKLKEKPAHKMLSRITIDVMDYWRGIGYELLDADDVKNIESTPKHNRDKCLNMFIKWLETDPSASYSKLIDALNEYGLSTAVEKIKKGVFK